MRTLVNLMSSDRGYICVYAERDGFAYELSTYAPVPTRDLFASMNGFSSPQEASDAAGYMLAAVDPRPKRRSRRRP